VKDEGEVARYYKLAADQNHVSAQKRYAICFANGRGVATNEAETARYFELAADQNHVSTQKHYAVCLANGGKALHRLRPRLLDTSNSLPIRLMHHPKIVSPFALRPGEAL
jgi:TPR repeat protein